jgi:hypothetical protein
VEGKELNTETSGASPAVQEQGVHTQERKINPFETPVNKHVHAGAVSIESQRAIASIQARVIVGKNFPRNKGQIWQRVMLNCSRKVFAEDAFYTYPRGGKSVSGPSIRFAEMMAREWGNVQAEIKELSSGIGFTEMLASVWDYESNVSYERAFVVRHERYTNGLIKTLTDPRDISELCSNIGARHLRGRILAAIDSDMIADAVEQCKATLAGKSDTPIADRIKRIMIAFEKYGVKPEQLAEFCKVDDIMKITADNIVDLQGVFNAIKDGAKVGEYFGDKGAATAGHTGNEAVDKLNQAARDKKAAAGGNGKQGAKTPATAAETKEKGEDLGV